MDVLWSPWRYAYITGGPTEKQGCVFCNILNNSASDEDNFILKRAEFNFVILNIYPYSTGHLMVIPYQHAGSLAALPKSTSDEMMDLVKTSEKALVETYSPDGLNLGLNLGKAAGAGVDGHIHMHALPRWVGDANFMTAIGQTRTIPETLPTSFEKLKVHF